MEQRLAENDRSYWLGVNVHWWAATAWARINLETPFERRRKITKYLMKQDKKMQQNNNHQSATLIERQAWQVLLKLN